MTEQEWLACTDPNAMLEFLAGKASDRKLHLFAIACCRRIWPLITDDRSHRAVELLESAAEGTANMEEMAEAARAAQEATQEFYPDRNLSSAKAAAHALSSYLPAGQGWRDTDSISNALYTAFYAASAISHLPADGCGDDEDQDASEDKEVPSASTWLTEREQAEQCRLLRCILGPSPFRPLPAAASLTNWSHYPVRTLAQAIYQDRTFDRLPSLADALEEAGCPNPEILAHCREPGPHARGCWVLDLILGKE